MTNMNCHSSALLKHIFIIFILWTKLLVSGVYGDSKSNNGWINCKVLCNPEEGYGTSCSKYCPDYIIHNNDNLPKESPNKFPWIVVVSIACPILLASIILVVVFIHRRRKNSISQPDQLPVEAEDNGKLKTAQVIGERTKLTQLDTEADTGGV